MNSKLKIIIGLIYLICLSSLLYYLFSKYDLKDLVDIIIKKIDFNGKVVYNVEQPDGQYKKPSDNSRMKKYINEFEFTSIEDGIEETINWFLENYGKARK